MAYNTNSKKYKEKSQKKETEIPFIKQTIEYIKKINYIDLRVADMNGQSSKKQKQKFSFIIKT